MAIIKVQAVPQPKFTAQELLAELCYIYPQYTLAVAKRLPAKDVMLLLRVARRKKAMEYFNLTQIAAAPHTKRGRGVKTLTARYQKDAKNG